MNKSEPSPYDVIFGEWRKAEAKLEVSVLTNLDLSEQYAELRGAVRDAIEDWEMGDMDGCRDTLLRALGSPQKEPSDG